MRRFWKQHREDEIGRLLRLSRPEPRDEFVASLLGRLEPQQQRSRRPRMGGRVLVAAAVTALAVGAGVAAGATHVAGTSISNLVNVGQSGGKNANAGNGGNAHHKGSNEKADSSPSPADDQYTVAVCHHTGSTTNPWVEIFVSPQGAANLVKHHPPDYIVGAPGNPTTCPP
jgi:hypothetical protein